MIEYGTRINDEREEYKFESKLSMKKLFHTLLHHIIY